MLFLTQSNLLAILTRDVSCLEVHASSEKMTNSGTVLFKNIEKPSKYFFFMFL